MKHRIAVIAIDDILADAKMSSSTLDDTCRRNGLKVTGCCAGRDNIFVLLTPNHGNPRTYRFAPFPSASDQDIITELDSRYQAGFSVPGSFFVGDTLWGLFEREVESGTANAAASELRES